MNKWIKTVKSSWVLKACRPLRRVGSTPKQLQATIPQKIQRVKSLRSLSQSLPWLSRVTTWPSGKLFIQPCAHELAPYPYQWATLAQVMSHFTEEETEDTQSQWLRGKCFGHVRARPETQVFKLNPMLFLTMLNTKRSHLYHFDQFPWYFLISAFSFYFFSPCSDSSKTTVLRHWWRTVRKYGACLHTLSWGSRLTQTKGSQYCWLPSVCQATLLHAALESALPTILKGNTIVLIL